MIENTFHKNAGLKLKKIRFIKAYLLLVLFILQLPGKIIYAQDAANSDSISDPLSEYSGQIPSLISYLSLNLNALGDPDLRSKDKDIIITQSYAKFFQSNKVQIEDDLDTARRVVTYKDVQAYLKDVEFFFKQVQFEFEINDIEQGLREDGLPFFRVDAIRHLKGIGLRGDTIDNSLQRFIEINIDPSSEELRIASIYTTGMRVHEERRLWWSNLPANWQILLGSDHELDFHATAVDSTEMANDISLIKLDLVHAFSDALLITQTDTFLLRGWQKSPMLLSDSMLLFGSDSLLITKIDSLPFSVKKVDSLIDSVIGLRKLTILEIPDEGSWDLEPLRRITGLKDLQLVGLNNTDYSPLRNLSELKTLNLKNSSFSDIGLLKYSTGLEVLDAANTGITGLQGLMFLKNLSRLDLSNTEVDSLGELKALKKLEELNLSGIPARDFTILEYLTNLVSLNLIGCEPANIDALAFLEKLEFLKMDSTQIYTVEPLSKLQNLREVSFNYCPVEDLSPLDNKPLLRKVYCDFSKVQDNKAQEFMRNNAHVLVIYGTERLRQWWESLDLHWRGRLLMAHQQIEKGKSVDSSGFAADRAAMPGRETLHAISELRSFQLLGDTLIRDLNPLRQLANLDTLRIRNCGILDLSPLSNLNELRTLDVSGNPIENIDTLGTCRKLNRLNISGTFVEELSLNESFSALRLLLADDCPLNERSERRFRELHPNVLVVYQTPTLQDWWTSLDSNWQVTLLQNAGLNAFLQSAPSESIASPDAIGLETIVVQTKIVIPPNTTGDLRPLEMLSDLEDLNFSDNQVSNLWPLNKLKRLRKLNCSNNPVDNLDVFEDMPSLTDLWIDNTGVTDLSPVSGHSTMRQLHCAGTHIRNLNALILMGELELLDCSNTKVKSLKPILDNTSIKKLIAFNSGISESKIEKFKITHPQCEVVFY